MNSLSSPTVQSVFAPPFEKRRNLSSNKSVLKPVGTAGGRTEVAEELDVALGKHKLRDNARPSVSDQGGARAILEGFDSTTLLLVL